LTALIAGVLGGVIAALITLFGVLTTSRWRIAEENIIQQRAEWRDAVRSIVGQAVSNEDSGQARRLWAELALRMNPDDDPEKDDRELVRLVRSLERGSERNDAVRGRIVDLAAHILKHDWTRAKWEANGWLWEDEPEQKRLVASDVSVLAAGDGDPSKVG
jgi:hypothetical protein